MFVSKSRGGWRRVAAPALFLACLAAQPAAAQPADGGTASGDAEPGARIQDPYDVAAPRGAVRAFIDAARAGQWAEAASHLDLESIPEGERPEVGARRAWQLKTVLDRSLWIDFERVSDAPSGELEDGLPPDLESLGRIDDAEILLQRVEAADGTRPWRFSSGTVRRIPALYEAHGYGMIEELLPQWMFDVRFLELQLWQWAALISLVLAAWIGAWLAVWLAHLLLRPMVARSKTDLDDRLLEAADSPARLLVGLALFRLGTLAVGLSVKAQETLDAMLKAVAVVGITWLALRLIDVGAAVVHDRLVSADRRTALAVVPLGRRTVKAFLIALALIAVLQNLGFHVTGLLAGLGVGGLAVALAAQKTIENLFGGVTLIADQPVRVGDFCRFGDGRLGTVEQIGLRSTRIRTPDRTLVTVPNSQFSEIHLENFAARDRIRLLATLGLRYETSPDQLRWVLAELRRRLVAHPMVDETMALRVRFVGFGAHSLDLEVLAYVKTPDFNEFLAVREDLYLQFMDVVAAGGSGFAFPSQTLYMARDEGLDEARARAGEERVREWRKRGDLPFPEYSDEALAAMRGSGSWPPEGSALAPTHPGQGAEDNS